jgi:DNA-dependent protein kinase catalytic subunit
LSLKTFEIVPITKRLGLLEWVSNTEPLRSIIDFELDKHYKIKGIGQTHANHLRKTWLRSLAAASDDNYVQHHMIALTKDFTSVVNNFKTHEKSIPWDLIRQSLLNMGRTPESFLYFRKKFIDSLATLSIAGYIIGLGDRHLDNFLLDRSDGSLVLIDFGVSFGQGISLGIPELMPFRLTRQFQSVFSPEGLEGQFRHSMLNSLKSLQKNQNTLLDCCEVFINEPLQDWMRGSSIDKNIPLKKLRILKQKLNGSNSGHIMTQELQDSKHLNMVRNS